MCLIEYGFLVVGLLGIIDNDIVGIDYIIGFDIVVVIVVENFDCFCDILVSYNCIFVVEVMGRNVGDIVFWLGIVVGVD